MSMISNIKAKIESDATISPLVGTRVFYRNPIDEQTDSYITFVRPAKSRSMVAEENRFQFFVYAKDSTKGEIIANALIDLFEDLFVVGTDTYYKIYFLNQSDSNVRLTNGFYFNILNFVFKKTT